MSDEEKILFYEESKWFAKLMGIREENLPSTFLDFQKWMNQMMDGQEVVVSDEARDIASSLLQLPLPIFWPANYLLAAGMLPPKIRAGFGLKWNKGMQICFDLAVTAVQGIVQYIPERFRTTPYYWEAIARAGVKSTE
jgi:uncharacterized protein (DUF2236 family)